MASVSQIEEWFSILGAGMAGLRLLKEYGIRTVELQYFIENFDKSEMKISAFAPPPLRDQYEPKFSSIKGKIISGIKAISNQKVSADTLNKLLVDTREMYILLNDVHRTVTSGFILTQ
jgi:hypothetical protein